MFLWQDFFSALIAATTHVCSETLMFDTLITYDTKHKLMPHMKKPSTYKLKQQSCTFLDVCESMVSNN